MTKYLFIILLIAGLVPMGHANTTINDFEAELRLLESRDLEEEEKAEELVEKISAQNNSNGDQVLIEDRVVSQRSAISKDSPGGSAPIIQESNSGSKIRRIPSR